jgi:hypothetical protein
LKQTQVFPFLVEPSLQLADLLELHPLVRKELSFVPFSRELDVWRRVPSSDRLFFL